MYVSIHSHFDNGLWCGTVPFERADFDSDDALNEALFRTFNRVDSADCRRLEDWGYRLPSLSVEDLVSWGGKTFQVARVGFVPLEEGDHA